MATKLSPDAQFFHDHAGYSYGLDETPEQGRTRCALALAAAEQQARNAGVSFGWEVDRDIDSSDFSDEEPAWELWQCVAYNADGEAIESLGAVDFGRDGSPHSSTYARVMQAELALQHFSAN